MEDAFRKLKAVLITISVMPFPDFDHSFVVETDASSYALGAALAQKKADGQMYPCNMRWEP